MRTLLILATVVAAAIAFLLWQLLASDPKPQPQRVAATEPPPPPAPTPSPADAGARPPRRPPPPRTAVAEREPPEPGVPVERPAPHFDGPKPEPEPEPEPDDLSDVAPERISRCERAIAHTFDLWARESAQGDPEQFRKALVAGRPQALSKCARGEVSLEQMDCVLAATSTEEIGKCGIGGGDSAEGPPAELDDSPR